MRNRPVLRLTIPVAVLLALGGGAFFAWRSLNSSGAARAGPATYSGDTSTRQGIPVIVFVGDTQRTSVWERIIGREQNDAQRQAVIERIAKENPALLIILGDLVFQGDDQHHWELFDEVAAPIRRQSIPVFPLPGNHEYFGDNRKGFDYFFARFPHLNRQLWNAVKFGSVAIILLDSNFDKMSRDLIDGQDEWYRTRLKEYQGDDRIKTVIVCCHHAPFTNSSVVSDDSAVQAHFVEPFKATPKAKVFFTGHCHSYERFAMFDKQFVVSGGGGGPRQELIVDRTKRRHEDQYNGGRIREFHFCKVTLEQDRLRVQMVRIDAGLKDWSVGDEFVVN